jgi:hypothetical protein
MPIAPPKDRPTGVTILAMLYFINAGVTFVQIMAVIFWGIVDFQWGAVCCALPFFLVVMLYISIGTGLFMMLKWAWMWALLLAIFGILFGLGNLVSVWAMDDIYPDGVPGYYYAFPALQLVFNLLIVWYLFQTRDSFRDLTPEEIQAMQQQQMQRGGMMGGGMMPPAAPPAQPPAEPPAQPPAEPPAQPPAEPPAQPPAEPPAEPPQQ